MAYEIDTIKISQTIFYELLCNGQLDEQKAPELYRAYVEREEVMNLVKSQGEIADCQVERYGSSIYIMPNVGNTQLGFGKAELKKILCKANANNKKYYLTQFIILTLLVEFYDGQGSRSKSREFMKMGEFQNRISERLQTGLALEQKREQEEDGETEWGLDFQSMIEVFETLKSAEINSRASTTKEGILNIVMDFLEEQGLVIYIQEDDMIKTTDKLDHLMEMKILNKNNYQQMMEAMGVSMNE